MSLFTTHQGHRRVFSRWAAVLKKVTRRKSFGERLSQSSPQRRWRVLPWGYALPFSGDLRRQQIERITTDVTSTEIQETESWINRNLVVSTGSLGLAVVGAFLFPPLRLLSLVGIVYGSVPIYQSAYRAVVHERRGNVDILYAVTQALLVLKQLFVLANLGCLYFFFSLKLLLMAKERFKQNLQGILADLPMNVHVLVNGVVIEQTLEEINQGDIVVVYPGETVPVDGVIAEGVGTIDEHILTGKFQPAEKTAGDSVFAYTVVNRGKILVLVQESGKATTVAQIDQILKDSVAFKADAQFGPEKLTDKSALPLVAVGVLSLPFIGPDSAAAVINSHPHRRLIIPTSLAVVNFINVAAQQGILIKDGRALELLVGVDTVVFDKTGTLTLDGLHVGRIHPCAEYTEETVLSYAAAAETRQTHPIATAICHAAETRELTPPPIEDTHYHTGRGLTMLLDGQHVRVGSVGFMQQDGISIPSQAARVIEDAGREGISVVLVAVNNDLAGLIELHATLRPEVLGLIEALRQRNLSLYIVSGDHEKPTQKLAESLGIDQYVAEAMPDEKANLIGQLQSEGRSVCFVGDGVNDTVAMKQAVVSVSLQGATSAATRTADIVLMDNQLNQLLSLFELADECQTNSRAAMMTTLGAAVLSVGGAFFLRWGMLIVELMKISFPVSLGIAMWPRLRYRNTSATQDSTPCQTHPKDTDILIAKR